MNAVRTENRRKVSDVVDILLFLAEFVKDKRHTIKLLDRLLSGKPGLLDQHGKNLCPAFGYLSAPATPASDFNDILKMLFNSPTPAKLHVLTPEGDGRRDRAAAGRERCLWRHQRRRRTRLLQAVRRASRLHGRGREGVFRIAVCRAEAGDSTINVLIGSKKFTEGWNSWRVSTMGLMNVGKSEGSEIIQLFGRGVRLKGYGMCLKRSSQIEASRSRRTSASSKR